MAIHKYLTFSFVPGEHTLIRGICGPLPRRAGVWGNGALAIGQYFELLEQLDPSLTDSAAAVRRMGELCESAVEKRLLGHEQIGLFLSDGLDSSFVALWLKQAGAKVNALGLDCCEKSVDRARERELAQRLNIPLYLVPVQGWFRGPLLLRARERLLDGLAPYRLFCRDYLDRLLSGRSPGIHTRRGVKIWLLMTLGAWLRGVLRA